MYYQRKDIDYSEYKFRQGKKARDPDQLKKMQVHEAKRRRRFLQIFKKASKLLHSGPVLCLGARTGCEVKMAIKAGFSDSIGVDLYPLGKGVLQADWHDLPFKDSVFPNAFTNSLDHCYDVELLAEELKRVLIPGGIFYFQLEKKKQVLELKDKQSFIQSHSVDFLFWDHGSDLSRVFEERGFKRIKYWDDGRWENFILKVDNEAG